MDKTTIKLKSLLDRIAFIRPNNHRDFGDTEYLLNLCLTKFYNEVACLLHFQNIKKITFSEK